MLIFGHIGITLGVGILGMEVWQRVNSAKQPKDLKSQVENNQSEPMRQLIIAGLKQPPQKACAPVSRGGRYYWFWILFWCALGSLLPDIIDKPIGHFLFSGIFQGNGRIISHTLLFAFLVFVIGLILYFTKRSPTGLVVAYAVCMHLILDFMWQTPQTLFWPMLGWSFPLGENDGVLNWLLGMWQGLLRSPTVWIAEIIGLAVAVGLGVWIWRTRSLLKPE